MPFLVFPGQGTQRIGMARAAATRSSAVSGTLDHASAVLDLDLRDLLWHGDLARLTRTENAQPAIVVVSVAVFRLWAVEAKGDPDIDWVSGHSVGALSAAIAAGAISFEDGVVLARRRGRLMADAPGEGGMLAVAVTSDTSARDVSAVAERLSLAEACRNGDRSIVLSGLRADIHAAREALGSRSVVLDVSHGFHSPLMDPIVARWREIVTKSNVVDPVIPFISSRTGKLLRSAEAVAEDLVEGLRSPVRWDLVGDVADRSGDGVALGEGSVLARMWRGRPSFHRLQVYDGERSVAYG